MTDETWLRLMRFGARCGCHQLPERSFFWGTWQFPVCSRCTGLPLGWLIGVPVGLLLRPHWAVGLCCLLVMGLDWGLQRFCGIPSNNPRRFVTGILGGLGYVLLLVHIIFLFFS